MNCIITVKAEKKNLKILDKRVTKMGVSRSAYISILLKKQIKAYNKQKRIKEGDYIKKKRECPYCNKKLRISSIKKGTQSLKCPFCKEKIGITWTRIITNLKTIKKGE